MPSAFHASGSLPLFRHAPRRQNVGIEMIDRKKREGEPPAAVRVAALQVHEKREGSFHPPLPPAAVQNRLMIVTVVCTLWPGLVEPKNIIDDHRPARIGFSGPRPSRPVTSSALPITHLILVLLVSFVSSAHHWHADVGAAAAIMRSEMRISLN